MANKGQTNAKLEKHGTSWCFRARVNGQQKWFTVCPLDTNSPEYLDKVARELKKVQMLQEVNGGKSPVQETEKPQHLTVKVAGDSWLQQAQTRRRNPIRGNTVKGYVNLLNWIYGVAGQMLLSEFKSVQAKQVIDAMHSANLSSKTINESIGVMQQIIESVKDGQGQPIYNWKLDRDVMDAPSVEKSETKAFTGEQIEGILQRAGEGKYRTMFALLAGTGLRIGEVLGIEINADTEKVTTLSQDCRVLYVRTQVLQDGTERQPVKTLAGNREVDIHPDLAAMLKELIGNRTSGYLFRTENDTPILYANLIKNVFDPILYGWERKKMEREGKGWKCVGVEKHPGVLGSKADFQDKANSRTGYGQHSFRRFRETHLAAENINQMFIDFWVGHGEKTVSDLYKKALTLKAKRRELCEQAGLGFKLTEHVATETIKKAGVVKLWPFKKEKVA